MKLVLLAGISLQLFAQDPDAVIGCLIGNDTKAIYGLDVERYQNFKLAQLYPVWLGRDLTAPFPVKKIIGATPSPAANHSAVLILRGTSYSAGALAGWAGPDNPLRTFLGFPAVALSPESMLVLVSPSIAVTGETDSISHALDRVGSSNCPSEIYSQMRELDTSYDAWFLVQRPMEQINLADLLPENKHRDELAQSIESVRGGVRVGPVHSFRLEVTTKDPDDAGALAVLGRWLPAMIENKGDMEGSLVRAIENYETRASGRTASLSFLLSETAIEAVRKEMESKKVDFGVGQ